MDSRATGATHCSNLTLSLEHRRGRRSPPQVEMTVWLIVVAFFWVVAILLLLSSLFTRSRSLGLWGDVMLAVSFGVSSAVLIAEKSYWIGGAFAIPAVRQIYVLVKPYVVVRKAS